jgi:hypothetical protein
MPFVPCNIQGCECSAPEKSFAMSLKIKYPYWMATEVTGWVEIFLAHMHTYSLGVGSRG